MNATGVSPAAAADAAMAENVASGDATGPAAAAEEVEVEKGGSEGTPRGGELRKKWRAAGTTPEGMRPKQKQQEQEGDDRGK